jgi:hypothetical protein
VFAGGGVRHSINTRSGTHQSVAPVLSAGIQIL